jgi:XapX domain-containing protein
MKLYFVSAIAGLLVGCLYALMQVRSPAPPLVALVGLCGIYMGELGTAALIQWIQSRT